MEVAWAALAILPVLSIAILLIIGIRRQRVRPTSLEFLEEGGPEEGGPGEAGMREPRRPLVPSGAASAEVPLPVTEDADPEATGSLPSSEGPHAAAS